MKIKLSKKKAVILISSVMLFILLFSIYAHYENNTLITSHYEVCDSRIPLNFDGLVVAQISDFHNTHSEKLQNDILSELEHIKPDIIVLTGDFIDSRKTDTELSFGYAQKLTEIAPVYMSTGNHEAASVYEYPPLEKKLSSIGVRVLRNECEAIEKDGQFINIMGIDDPVFIPGEKTKNTDKIRNAIKGAKYDKEVFTITLSHRPEIFSVYIETQQHLVLAGHAHGGQFRLPLFGGLFTPTEGFFPEYEDGLHEKQGTKMIVSRGIGASVIPVRINNRPELVIITLFKETE